MAGKWQRFPHMGKRSVSGARRSDPEERLLDAISGGTEGPEPVLRVAPEALDSLAAGGYSEAEIFDLVVPKRTLARRQSLKQPLTVEETDKALRLARIADLARRVFGDNEKAHRWLRKPKRALKGRTPLAFLASEAGARAVEGMLNRIDHGVFA
jgi:putative toxin-antitoxin system antitoxin component (TIGR02293 family)